MTEHQGGRFGRGSRPNGERDIAPLLSAPSAELPTPGDHASAVERILRIHQRTGGATFSLYWGDVAGEPLYAVAIYPERSVIVPGSAPSAAALRSFIAANHHLLADPRNAVGTWFNEEDGNTYLDISTLSAHRDSAVELGERYNQIAIFDLATAQVIALAGTGVPPLDLPPIEQRLPPRH